MNLNEIGEGIVEIHQHLLVENSKSPLLNLVEFFYPRFLHNMNSVFFFFFMKGQNFVLQLNV